MRLTHFLYISSQNKNEWEHETVTIFKLLNSKNDREHETVAFLQF